MGISKMLRRYEVKNLNAKEFIRAVVKSLSKELNREVKLETIDNKNFKISIDGYEILMSERLINGLNKPCGVDIYILEQAQSQGFEFDDKVRIYIENCYKE